MIKKRYIIDQNQQPIAVPDDIRDFEKMEQIIEDNALGRYIEKNDPKENLSVNNVKEYYRKLNKK